MGYLDAALRDGDEAAVGQCGEDVSTSRLRSRSSSVRGARRRTAASPSPSPTRRSIIGAHERLVPVRDAGVGAFGQAGDGAVHAPGLTIGSRP